MDLGGAFRAALQLGPRLWRTWGSRPTASEGGADRLGYRLTGWPDLPATKRNAGLLGALSVMSTRPVTVSWFARRLRWRHFRARAFLDGLVDQGLASPVTAPQRVAGDGRTRGGAGPQAGTGAESDAIAK